MRALLRGLLPGWQHLCHVHSKPDRQEPVKETLTSAAVVAKTTSVHSDVSEERSTFVDTIDVVGSDTDEDVLICEQPHVDEELHKLLTPVDDTLGDTNEKGEHPHV